MVPPKALEAGFTSDIDYIGTGAQAQVHAEALREAFPGQVRYQIATMSDPPPTTGVILVGGLGDRTEPVQIDYLSALKGYLFEDEARLRRFAANITIDGREVLLMHPFDCLKSRAHNYATLPSKHNAAGLGQLEVSVKVVRAYLAEACEEGWEAERGVGLPVAEHVVELAHSRDGIRLYREDGIDLLEAVPHESFCPSFREKRWPQAVAYVARKRVGGRPKKQARR